MKNTTEWATIGKIVAPFGIHGELKVFQLTDIPDRFVSLKAIYLGPTYQRYLIKSVRPYKGEMLVIKLDGISDATTAEELRNRDIYIPLSDLALLPPDSYYQHDILGLQVYKLDNTLVGTVIDILVTGSNDVYVLKAEDGKQFLIPAIKDVVKQIDLMRHVMYIDPMKGLLDDDAVTDDPTEEENE